VYWIPPEDIGECNIHLRTNTIDALKLLGNTGRSTVVEEGD